MKFLARLATLTLVLASAAAPAATLIHRCGNEYTDLPCAQSRTFSVADTVTAERRAEARQVAIREKALAADMVRDRAAHEAAFRPAGAVSLGGPRPAEPSAGSKKAANKKARKTEPSTRSASPLPSGARDFVAAVPKARKSGS